MTDSLKELVKKWREYKGSATGPSGVLKRIDPTRLVERVGKFM